MLCAPAAACSPPRSLTLALATPRSSQSPKHIRLLHASGHFSLCPLGAACSSCLLGNLAHLTQVTCSSVTFPRALSPLSYRVHLALCALDPAHMGASCPSALHPVTHGSH